VLRTASPVYRLSVYWSPQKNFPFLAKPTGSPNPLLMFAKIEYQLEFSITIMSPELPSTAGWLHLLRRFPQFRPLLGIHPGFGGQERDVLRGLINSLYLNIHFSDPSTGCLVGLGVLGLGLRRTGYLRILSWFRLEVSFSGIHLGCSPNYSVSQKVCVYHI